MASENNSTMMKRFEAELCCSICLEMFNDTNKSPKLLPCIHTICQACLQTYIESSSQKGKIQCPTCRKTTKVPKDKAKGFNTNLTVIALLGHISQSMPKSVTFEELTCDDAAPIERAPLTCNVHLEIAATHICKECRQALCYKCLTLVVQGEIHKNHLLAEVAEEDETQRTELTEKLFLLKEQEKSFTESQRLSKTRVNLIFDKGLTQVSDRATYVTDQVKSWASELEAKLHKSNAMLVEEIDYIGLPISNKASMEIRNGEHVMKRGTTLQCQRMNDVLSHLMDDMGIGIQKVERALAGIHLKGFPEEQACSYEFGSLDLMRDVKPVSRIDLLGLYLSPDIKPHQIIHTGICKGIPKVLYAWRDEKEAGRITALLFEYLNREYHITYKGTIDEANGRLCAVFLLTNENMILQYLHSTEGPEKIDALKLSTHQFGPKFCKLANLTNPTSTESAQLIASNTEILIYKGYPSLQVEHDQPQPDNKTCSLWIVSAHSPSQQHAMKCKDGARKTYISDEVHVCAVPNKSKVTVLGFGSSEEHGETLILTLHDETGNVLQNKVLKKSWDSTQFISMCMDETERVYVATESTIDVFIYNHPFVKKIPIHDLHLPGKCRLLDISCMDDLMQVTFQCETEHLGMAAFKVNYQE